MDEKEEAQKQEEKIEGEATKEAPKDSKELVSGTQDAPKEESGSKERASPIEEARELDASIKRGNAEFKKLLEKNEKLLGEARLEGRSFAGQAPQTPAKLTDTEYAEALERGEVNPLKEDGFI